MVEFIMNATTVLGGVFGLLIGVATFFFVFLILGLPYVLMTRRPEAHLDELSGHRPLDSRAPVP